MQGPVDRPSSILDPFIARMNRWDFAALPQVVRVENYGDTTEFYWLQYYKIVMKRSKAPQSVNGIKNGRIYFLQITDQATSTILADFSLRFVITAIGKPRRIKNNGENDQVIFLKYSVLSLPVSIKRLSSLSISVCSSFSVMLLGFF